MSSDYEELHALYNYTNGMTEHFSNIQENITSSDVNSLRNMIQQQEGNIDKLSEIINDKDEELQNKMERTVQQQREIDYKKKLIATRNRMLQLSQEKNVYKNKVMYSLLSFVILLVIVLLVVYIYFKKK
jgi:cytochrome c-type biogenesis protein CcmH/NrfG